MAHDWRVCALVLSATGWLLPSIHPRGGRSRAARARGTHAGKNLRHHRRYIRYRPAAAEALAAMGARIILVARNKESGEATLTKLRRRYPCGAHSIHYANLLRLAEVKRVAAEIAAAEPRVDVLLNNAGAMFARRKITPDGLEHTFALNHVAPFVLTHGLRERLFAAAPAR